MAITDWPADDRPREKLLQKGSESLSDAELLAIFLRTGVRSKEGTQGKTAVDLARALLDQFGGLRSILEADKDVFCGAHGLGDAKYVQLQAVLEMGRRHLHENMIRGDSLTSSQHTKQFLSAQMRAYSHEVFACLFLDNKHRVIAFEEMFRGTIDSASVHPREVVKRALEHNSAALIFAHNHPSGDSRPSSADKSITQHLKSALALINVRVLDHFIIGDGDPVSFAEQGLL